MFLKQSALSKFEPKPQNPSMFLEKDTLKGAFHLSELAGQTDEFANGIYQFEG